MAIKNNEFNLSLAISVLVTIVTLLVAIATSVLSNKAGSQLLTYQLTAVMSKNKVEPTRKKYRILGSH